MAPTASEESTGKGGGGLKVAVLGVGAEAGGEVGKRSTAERVSRVAFSLGIALPPSKHAEAVRKDKAQRRERDQAALATRRSSPHSDGF